MVTRLLNLCGLYLGEDSDLKGVGPDNPDGFWENWQFLNLNEEILRKLGRGWDLPFNVAAGWELQPQMTPLRDTASTLIQQFKYSEPWGWKDPRNSLTLPFWKSLLTKLRVVVCLRNPIEVARSLQTRASSSMRFGFDLWLSYYKEIIATTSPQERIITHYSSYFLDCPAELRRILRFLEIELPDDAIERACAASKGSLRHHTSTVQELFKTDVPAEVVKLYRGLGTQAGPIYRAVLEAELAGDLLHRHLLSVKGADSYECIQNEVKEVCSRVEFNPNDADISRTAITEWLNAAHFLHERHLLAEIHKKEQEGVALGQAMVAVQAQVAEKEQAVQALSAQVAQREQAMVAVQAQVAEKDQAIRLLSGQLAAKDAQVERITSSLGWRLLSRYGRIKHRYLLPIYRLLGLMPPESTAMDIACASATSETSATSGSAPEAPPRPSLYDVIVFPIIDWEFRFQRPQQIAVRFARAGHGVFYVRTTFREHQKATIQAIEEGVFEVQLPGPSYISLYSHAMDEHLRGTLCDAFASLRQEFSIVEAVCFVNLPFWRPIALTLRDRFGWKVVYDCMDYHQGFSNNEENMLREEQDLIRASDLVLTTSRPLFADQSQRNPNCILVPNATDFEHFNVACGALPDELRNLGKPIIGYYGAIADWFDSELIHELALARPQWNFVLIGRTFGANLAPLRHSKNVHLLEEKPYSVLPPYLHAFDVCIIPFKKTPLTEMTNPVKLFEFLSAGKAVVATDLTELRHYSDYVELASTLEQWLLAIENALHDHSPERVAARVEFARHNTWDERVAQIKHHINALFPKASIVVVTYNNLDYTRLCLESIYKKTVYPNYEVIVVDNASIDGTVEFLKTFGTGHPNFASIFNEMNEGFASANNRGIAAATGEYIVFLNNDTIVTRGWLSGLINHLRHPQVGIVGPVTNCSGNESRIEVDYQTPGEMEGFAERYTRAHEGQTFEISMLALFCIAMRRSVIIDEVGLLDERFGIGMFEDDDYALRVKQKGYKVICAEDVFVHHWGRASFSKLSQEEYQRLFDENRRKFEEKWGMQWEPHRSRSGR
jgi:GT2 family glycosyltransferase/glycosyltransferase involved in cell wall biosynthesis